MIESIPILKCYFSDNLSIYMCISQLHKHPFSYTSEICVTEQKKLSFIIQIKADDIFQTNIYS